MSKQGFILIIINLFFFISFSSALSQPENAENETKTTTETEEDTVEDELPSDSLHALVLTGNESKLNEIFKVDTDINEIDSNGRTPLHIASEAGNLQISKLLIMQGANVNIQDKQGYTPLHLAIKSSNNSISKVLASNGSFLKYIHLHLS